MNKEIVLGTVQFGLQYGINNTSTRMDEKAIFDLLDTAYAEGIRTLDTAEAYGNAEEIIGRYHRSGGRLFGINTKFSNKRKGELRQSLQRSLDKLQVKNIQTYYFHSFAEYLDRSGVAEELEILRDKDHSIGAIGLSVYTNMELETAIEDPMINVIQLPFNLLDNSTKRGELLQKARSKNKRIQVRSVFLQGLFFKDISALPVYLLPLEPYLEKLHALSVETGISMESLCLQYANAQPGINEIIIGVDSKEQLLRNIHSLHKPTTEYALSVIDSIRVTETELLYPYNWK